VIYLQIIYLESMTRNSLLSEGLVSQAISMIHLLSCLEVAHIDTYSINSVI
jgi:hypothetical protein